MIRKLCLVAVVVALVDGPAAAQDSLPAGPGAGGTIGWWSDLPIGTQVIIGGVLFIVAAGGLLQTDSDKKPVAPTPTPTPPATTTTTTTS